MYIYIWHGGGSVNTFFEPLVQELSGRLRSSGVIVKQHDSFLESSFGPLCPPVFTVSSLLVAVLDKQGGLGGLRPVHERRGEFTLAGTVKPGAGEVGRV